jgi:hypothetical protein
MSATRRGILAVSLVLAAGIAALAQGAKPTVVRFGKGDLGRVPAGWAADKTGKGEGSVWKVVADDSAPSKSGFALAQTAASPGAMFNLCVLQDGSYRDMELTVAFKAVKGANDQGGGFVWRYQDGNNYYVCRMNPLEDNYRLYHVVAGKRTQFAGKEGLKVPTGTWHTLKVTMVRDKIECFLDGTKEIEATDTTFAKPGKVGLWTKADAQSHFDDFRVSDLGR